MPRSCASSILLALRQLSREEEKGRSGQTIMTEYRDSSGSTSVSRKSMPSVMYFMRVRDASETSSKRMV
jgi:hypothetical protein